MGSRRNFIRQIASGSLVTAFGKPLFSYTSGKIDEEHQVVDNPYQNIDWKNIKQVASASHVHVTDQEKLNKVCNILKLRHLPISNYYPSVPYFPPEKIMKNQFMVKQDFGTVFDKIGTGQDRYAGGKLIDGPLDWNKIIMDKDTGWYENLPDERKKQVPFSEDGPLFTDIPEDVIFSPNSEHHTFTNARNLHANALGSFFRSGTFDAHDEFLTVSNGYCPGAGRPWEVIFSKILDELQYKDAGGITINHPVWSGLKYEPVCKMLDLDPRVLGIEIYNDLCATRYGDPERGWALKMWDSILSSGRRCLGFCVPDWTVGRGTNILLVSELSGHSCLRAYRKGAFYGTIQDNGLQFNNITLENKTLYVETNHETTIRIVSEKGEVYKEETNGQLEYKLPLNSQSQPDCLYVRIEAIDETSDQLFSQPIRFLK